MTRAQKRAGSQSGRQEQLKAAGNNEDAGTDKLEVSAREVKELQDSDETREELEGVDTEEVDTEEEAEPDLPSWGATKEGPQYEISDHLDEEQRASLRQLLEEFKDILQIRPGRTQVVEQYIHTGAERPVKLPPYRLPYAYRRTVEKEQHEMLKEGVISRSTSEWAAPIVLIERRLRGSPQTELVYVTRVEMSGLPHMEKWPIHRQSSCFFFQIEFQTRL